jgi:hypothetical protein
MTPDFKANGPWICSRQTRSLRGRIKQCASFSCRAERLQDCQSKVIDQVITRSVGASKAIQSFSAQRRKIKTGPLNIGNCENVKQSTASKNTCSL